MIGELDIEKDSEKRSETELCCYKIVKFLTTQSKPSHLPFESMCYCSVCMIYLNCVIYVISIIIFFNDKDYYKFLGCIGKKGNNVYALAEAVD